jgi:hypothetical protein
VAGVLPGVDGGARQLGPLGAGTAANWVTLDEPVPGLVSRRETRNGPEGDRPPGNSLEYLSES